MEFPSFHFPNFITPHQKKRALFADFGVHSNLNLVSSSSDDLCTFFAQKCHLNSTECSPYRRISATFPSIPLSEIPVSTPYPFTDKINGRLIDEKRELIQFIISIKKHRAHRYHGNKVKKNEHYFELCDVLSNIEDGGGDGKKINISDWLLKKYTTYRKFRDITNIPIYNSQYCGGCVKYTSTSTAEQSCSILKTSGAQFDQIDLLHLTENNGLLTIGNVDTLTTDGSVYQLDANLGFCAARKSRQCLLLSVNASDGRYPLCVEKNSGTEFESILTDVCLSPYIAGECLISTEKGNYYHWLVDGRLDMVLKEKPHRFDCADNWRSCHYGAHPRQIVTVDRTQMELHDIRGPARNGVDLFALPSQYLDTKERIQVTKHHPVNFFYHIVATDYSLIIIDERFPNNPVLQWSHILQYPPQYLSLLDNINSASSEDLIILASQRPAETCCFQMKQDESFPPQSTCPQWKLCKIGDFFQFCEHQLGTGSAVMKERFNTSLSGIESFHIKSKGSFVTLQMDSYGEIFYQIYSQTEEDVDKTMSCGPGSEKIEMPDCVKPITTSWITKLHQELDEKTKKIVESKVECNVDATHLSERMFLQRQPHVLCKICMSDPEVDEKPACDEIFDSCLRCNLTLQEGARITDSVTKGDVIKQDLPDCFVLNSKLPIVDQYPQELTDTKILLKAWNGDASNVRNLLLAKDEERRNIKDRNRIKGKVDKSSDVNVLDVSISEVDELDKTTEGSEEESQASDLELHYRSDDSQLCTEYTALKSTLSASTPIKNIGKQRSKLPRDNSVFQVSSSGKRRRHRHSSESSTSSRLSQRSVLSEPCFQNLPSWVSLTAKKTLKQTDYSQASSSKVPVDSEITVDNDESLFNQSMELFSPSHPSSVTFTRVGLTQPSKHSLLQSASSPGRQISSSPTVKKKQKKHVPGF